MSSNNTFDSEQHNSLRYKYCSFCGKPIPRSVEYSCCADCQEVVLFQQVREYIRSNDVNEFQVAEHFNISPRLVKHWIAEGRIEYKTSAEGKFLNSIRCTRCGAPASFGTVCTACLKILNNNVHGYGTNLASEEDKMHYFDPNAKKN